MEFDVDALQLLELTDPGDSLTPCTISCAIWETCNWTGFTQQAE